MSLNLFTNLIHNLKSNSLQENHLNLSIDQVSNKINSSNRLLIRISNLLLKNLRTNISNIILQIQIKILDYFLVNRAISEFKAILMVSNFLNKLMIKLVETVGFHFIFI